MTDVSGIVLSRKASAVPLHAKLRARRKLNRINRYSIFEESKLRWYYRFKPDFVVFKMEYNLAFQKKVIRKELIEQVGLPADAYWGFMPLTETQFNDILNLGNADGRYIIN